MTLDEALSAIREGIEPGRAEGAAAYHKVQREYLGVPNPFLNDLAQSWRRAMTLEDRVSLADALWQTDIFEARLAAAKLLTQARIRPDDAVWQLIKGWVPTFDSWAIGDHACMAGQKRLVAAPTRTDEIADWINSPHMWTRRAAFVMTLPWTKQNHPSQDDLAIRDRVLGWAGDLAEDPDWFIQKAIAWWLRDLSKHDPARTQAFLDVHGPRLRAFARKEAGKYLPLG